MRRAGCPWISWIAWPALAGLWASSAAAAQTTAIAPSAQVACMTHITGASQPEYPPLLLDRKDGGTLDTTLTFSNAALGPDVKVADDGLLLAGLADAVKKYAQGLRVPCLAANAPPVVMKVSYVFIPNDGRKVVSSRPRDTADDARLRQVDCVAHKDGDKQPQYPYSALAAEVQGPVLVKMTFSAPDKPPVHEIVASVNSRHLRSAVMRYVEGLRMPCLTGAPVAMSINFQFRLIGGTRTLINDMNLSTFLGFVKQVPRGVYFDLTTMGCPFDLRVIYGMPHIYNHVGELEKSVPARRPFLDWLAGLEFALPEARNTQVLGQEFVLQVPCTIVNL